VSRSSVISGYPGSTPAGREDRDRQHFCDLLAEMAERFRIRQHAFVLMDNHYHLIVELTELNLSHAGQWLNGSYSTWFNRRHRKGNARGKYREYVESALREGLEKSPWSELKEQVVLGGEEFLESLRQSVKGAARDRRGAKRLGASRPSLAEVIAKCDPATLALTLPPGSTVTFRLGDRALDRRAPPTR
jgi:hypothetical protein